MNLTIPMVEPQGDEMITVVADAIKAVSAKAREQTITPDSRFLEEFALDSLDLVAVILRVQDHFQIELDPDDLSTMTHVGDLVAIVNQHLRAAA